MNLSSGHRMPPIGLGTWQLPCNGLNPLNVEYFFRLSLKALRLDYLDLYLIHVPIACQRTDDDYEVYPFRDGDVLTEIVNLTETWKVMESLVDKGLVRSLGLSNCNSRQIQTIYDAARIKPANVQVECHAYLPQEELFEFCKNLRITFTAYSPLGSPGLPDYVKKHHHLEIKPIKLLDDERLLSIAEKHRKTKAQILIRFLIERSMIPIPKSTHPDRIRENIEVFDFALDKEDMEILRSMKNGFRYFKFDFAKSLLEHPEQPFNGSF
nr:aldo-keto reductase family 1 member A1-A isoform X2 [Parasteatoda tepidariorum]